MGTILDSVLTFKDNITGGGARDTLAAASGDSLAVRWFEEGTRVTLLDWWGGNNVSKMDVFLRSPLMHDNISGLRAAHMFNPTQSGADGNPNLYLPPGWKQPLIPTDTLISECLGTAADDVTVCHSILYETPSMKGGNFISAEQVVQRSRNLVGIRISPPPAAATSTWGTSEAINSDDDRLKANTDYALLGLTTDLPFTALKLFGPDTGNFGIPIPGYRDENISSGWFLDLSKRFNMPLVPVINSNNKGVTFTAAADVGGGTAPLISLLFAELSGGGSGF
jgi:hypothetical protein